MPIAKIASAIPHTGATDCTVGLLVVIKESLNCTVIFICGYSLGREQLPDKNNSSHYFVTILKT